MFFNDPSSLSPLEKARLVYSPAVPSLLRDLKGVSPVFHETRILSDEVRETFPSTHSRGAVSFERRSTKDKQPPFRVGVFFSGGQAPGGHNVVAGLLDALLDLSPESELIGFLGGPGGFLKGEALKVTSRQIDLFRNRGGFDLLGSDRTKIETAEQFHRAREVVNQFSLDGLIVIGGDDSNTNAAYLAEDFVSRSISCTVIGIPKTIDGDLKNQDIEVSFGFDTASKVYAELIGNLAKDLLSAKKMWAFVKVMGRSASHLTLECSLLTQPNMALISENIQRKGMTLLDVVSEIVDLITQRAKQGKNYGLILIPEGLIEFLTIDEKLLKNSFPLDPHGNVQVSKIETERLLIELVESKLKEEGVVESFTPQPFFFGYEGRSASPSNFDANYSYSLGRVAALGVIHRAQGTIACLKGLKGPVEGWVPTLVPITSMICFEMRKGKRKGVVKRTLVDLNGLRYKEFLSKEKDWGLEDHYLSPGPIQFYGPEELTESRPLLLKDS